mgnify:CR=1 FL=1
MPVRTKAHHTQLPATPSVRTMSVTRFGVSLANVVATIDRPASHQGTARPEAKNSDVPLRDLAMNRKAGAKQMARATTATTQSQNVNCMVRGSW